ncbi:MAG: glycosyltransferase family 4 protein [Alphaproteobacteria bacterium]|nr:glycosyltransferase family 4 protein [Alphaproteobacteria bacterium]
MLRRVKRRLATSYADLKQVFFPQPCFPITLVSDGADWALDRVAQDILRGLEVIHPGMATISSSISHHRNSTVHFMSRNLWNGRGGGLHPSNRAVVFSLHGQPDDSPGLAEEISSFVGSLRRISLVATCNETLRLRLLQWGIPKDKLAIIPHAVDCSLLRPCDNKHRQTIRQELGIPHDSFCIGSFQKDGEGWEAGMVPKLVKGPDLFLATIENVAKRVPLFVLLTGPARGYVKAGLDRIGVPYRHVMVERYEDIVPCHQAIDLYLVSSRDEGGPLASLEALACATPVVSTPVGMLKDLIRNNFDGVIAESFDPLELSGIVIALYEAPEERKRIGNRGRDLALTIDLVPVARQWWEKVYAPQLMALGRLDTIR